MLGFVEHREEEGYLCAFVGEFEGSGCANAAGGAGGDGNFTGEGNWGVGISIE